MMWKRYIEIKRPRLKQSTATNYNFLYNKYVEPDFGKRKVSKIRRTDIIRFYQQLMANGFKSNSLDSIHTIIHPTLEMAVNDNIIRNNPSDKVMRELDRSKPEPRHALTEEQQESLIKFMKGSETYSHWLPLFTFFLGTGCRVGEAVGLTWNDIDFANNSISINHNLVYRVQDSGRCENHISTPKTNAGVRVIPMMSDVKSMLLKEKEKELANSNKEKVIIDGFTDWVFTNRYNNPHVPMTINKAIKRIIKAHNESEEETAKKDNREAIILPHFSAHHLRHTFCTRYCENESNLKLIQDIMGHSDISTTMIIYAEATHKKKVESMENLDGKIVIA